MFKVVFGSIGRHVGHQLVVGDTGEGIFDPVMSVLSSLRGGLYTDSRCKAYSPAMFSVILNHKLALVI